MSDKNQNDLDSSGQAPRWLRGSDSNPSPLAHALAKRGHAVQRKPVDAGAQWQTMEDIAAPAQKQPEKAAESVVVALRQPREPGIRNSPLVLLFQPGLAFRSVIAVGVAALVVLGYVVVYPALQGSADLEASAPRKSSQPSLPSQRSPMLILHSASGSVNQPLPLGVNISLPSADATVSIRRMPAGARLTVGKRMGPEEWRVPAREISQASIIPPIGFTGAMDLTAELRGPDGATLASIPMQLNWTSTPQSGAIATSANPATVGAFRAPAPPMTSLRPAGTEPSQPPKLEIKPREVADFIRRAKDRLDQGDLHAARLLLLRAAEAQDPNAALYLAKTFDPMLSKQFGAFSSDPDPAQARSWYQKAQEWGSPEAQHQLDTLASYR